MSKRLGNTDPALLHAWHPIALAASVDHTPRRVVVCGEAWVLARTSTGLLALPDECPHRGAPLSEGTLHDDCLRCPYHGWTFAADGTCVEIPALDASGTIPRRADRPVPAGLEERYGIVWMAPRPPLVDLVAFPEWTSGDFPLVQGSVTEWHAGAAQMVDNFLDVAHFPFTHLGTFGLSDDRVVLPYTTRRDGWRVLVEHRHLAQSADPSVTEPDARSQTFEYVAPFSMVLRITYERSGDDIAILFAVQPVDDTTSVLYRWNLRNDVAARRRDPLETEVSDTLVIDEDRDLLQRFAHKAMPLDVNAELHTRADRSTIELRRVLHDLVAAASPSSDTVPVDAAAVAHPSLAAGIHHVAICVDDLDAALAFYTDVLGLERVWRPDTLPNPGAWLQLGDQQVHLLSGTARAPETFQHFAVPTADLRIARDRLRAHGIELEGHQVIERYGLQAFVRDPSGNVVEFFHQQWPVPDDLLEELGLDHVPTAVAR